MAKVAMAHGINANVVHRWRQRTREGQGLVASQTSEFVPVSLAPKAATEPAGNIQIQLRRGATVMMVTWPVSAAAQLAAWTCESLQ